MMNNEGDSPTETDKVDEEGDEGHLWQCQVNKKMIPVKLNYFFQYCVMGVFMMYLNLILESFGLSATQIGIGTIVSYFLGTISRITFGALSDRMNKRSLFMAVLSGMSGVIILLFFAFPKPLMYTFEGNFLEQKLIVTESNTTTGSWPIGLKSCKSNHDNKPSESSPNNLWLLDTSGDGRLAIYGIPNNVETNGALKTYSNMRSKVPSVNINCQMIIALDGANGTHSYKTIVGKADFKVVVAAIIVRSLFYIISSPIMSLLDSHAFDLLGSEKAEYYGRSRLFGSLGYMLSAVVTGICISGLSFGKSVPPNYDICIILGSVSFFLGMFASIKPINSAPRVTLGYFCKTILRAFLHRRMISCLIIAFLSGILLAIFEEYLFLIFTKYYNVPQWYLGICVVALIASEVPSFILSGYILKRINANYSIAIAHAIWVVVFLNFAYFTNYWWYLIGQALSGVAYPLMYNAVLNEAAFVGQSFTVGKGNLITTMQSLVISVLFSIASGIGGLLWGLLLDVYGGRTLFYIAAAYSTAAVLLTLLINMITSKSLPMVSSIGIT